MRWRRDGEVRERQCEGEQGTENKDKPRLIVKMKLSNHTFLKITIKSG